MMESAAKAGAAMAAGAIAMAALKAAVKKREMGWLDTIL